ncbi:hypothetical protein AAC387_Pa10g0227 [Persea americana]
MDLRKISFAILIAATFASMVFAAHESAASVPGAASKSGSTGASAPGAATGTGSTGASAPGAATSTGLMGTSAPGAATSSGSTAVVPLVGVLGAFLVSSLSI